MDATELCLRDSNPSLMLSTAIVARHAWPLTLDQVEQVSILIGTPYWQREFSKRRASSSGP